MSIAVVVALVSALGVGSLPIDATEAAQAQAKAAFQRGERAFLAHDFQGALASFQEAFRALPSDAVRFNIAVCLERLARFREAIAEYDAARLSATLDEPGRARASTNLDRLRPWLGALVVTGSRIGARIIVDGQDRGAVPATIEVDPRRQTIVFRDALGELTETIEPARGQTLRLNVDRPLTPLPPPPVAASGLSALGVVGIGVTAVGAAGTLGFGLWAQDLYSEYNRDPTLEVGRRGINARNLANGSIAVVGLGAAIVLVDLFLLND